MRMSFEYYFTKHWWRVVIGLVVVIGPLVWLKILPELLGWIPTVAILGTILFASAMGVHVIYKAITRPSCTCCTAGDSCIGKDGSGCERHCALHCPKFPRATIVSRK